MKTNLKRLFWKYGASSAMLIFLIVGIILFALYGERLNPWDGIAFDAPRCSSDAELDRRFRDCFKR